MKNNTKVNGAIVIGALGVVYGDIGTSPLYALKESFHHMHELQVIEANVLGVLSLIFWSLILIISLKYHLLILKADNEGEGGILALTALISTVFKNSSKRLRVLTLLGLFGTALLYGDGMITPAISVLSAVEGLELVQPGLHPFIVPITVIILIGLFSIQRHGTAAVGRIFGPITLTWFIIIGVLGLMKIIENPHVLAAVNPSYAFEFFVNNGGKAFMVLGSVFLVVTGGEALYSDLGHFGRHPIDFAWFSCVLPCLFLNYFGQGALLLQDPTAIRNPFYLLAPQWALLPLVIMATVATVVASQALITGVFSLTMQAVQLQYCPRMKISHTSHTEFGQIYVQKVNTFLMIACIALVISFKSSTALASAYGIAVTMTMLITTILFYFLARYSWGWSNFVAIPLCGFFALVECCFLGANLLKVVHGGWFPLVVGIVIFTIMSTWNKGRQILSARMLEIVTPMIDVIKRLDAGNIPRIPGIGIYLSGQPQYAPPALIQNLKHFKCLHEKVILVVVRTEEIPIVSEANRAQITELGHRIYKVQLFFGFMEVPDVPKALLKVSKENNLNMTTGEETYFIGQEHLLATAHRKGMALWREKLFAFMSRNSQSASTYFGLPIDRVVTLSSTIEL